MRSNLGKDGLQKITFPSSSSLIYNITGGFFFFFFFFFGFEKCFGHAVQHIVGS